MSKLFEMVVKVLAIIGTALWIIALSPVYFFKGELTDMIADYCKIVFGQKAYDTVYDIDKVICSNKIVFTVTVTSFVILVSMVVYKLSI